MDSGNKQVKTGNMPRFLFAWYAGSLLYAPSRLRPIREIPREWTWMIHRKLAQPPFVCVDGLLFLSYIPGPFAHPWPFWIQSRVPWPRGGRQRLAEMTRMEGPGGRGRIVDRQSTADRAVLH
eukprot:scaffold16573_cov50-Attheya_sp.AAC.6